jgi:hypothetical protein
MPLNPADFAALGPRPRRPLPAWAAGLGEKQPEWYDTAASTALRVVPGIAGTALGVVASSPTGPGAIAGGAAGGGAGSALGEWLAQQYEEARGLRSADTDWKAVATEGAIGALPFDEAFAVGKGLRAGLRGKAVLEQVPSTLRAMAPSVPSGILRGATAGAVGEGLRITSNEGEFPDLERLVGAGAFGGLIGGAGAGLIKGWRRYAGRAAQAPASRTAAIEEAAPGTQWMDEPPADSRIGLQAPPSRYDPTARRSSPEQYQVDQLRPTPPSNDVPTAVGVPSNYDTPLDELEALLTRYDRAVEPPPQARLIPRERFAGIPPLEPNANREAYFNPPRTDPNAPITDPRRMLPPPSPVDPSLTFQGTRRPDAPRLLGDEAGLIPEPRTVGRLADLFPPMPGASTRVPTMDEAPTADVELSPDMDAFRRLLSGEPLESITAPTAARVPRLSRAQQRKLTPQQLAEYRSATAAERTAERDARRATRQQEHEAEKTARAKAREDQKLAELNAALGLAPERAQQSTIRTPEGVILGEWDPMRWRQQGEVVDLGRPAPSSYGPSPTDPPITRTGPDVRPSSGAIVDRQPQPGDYTMVDAASLKTDAKLYQHKSGADAAGVLDKLRRVEAWDEMSGRLSPLLLHERIDGSRYVVDGHQRAGLAKRLIREGKPVPPLPAIVVREADGVTPEAARRMGALHNLRTGSAEPMDIAKLLREGELTPLESRMLSQISSDIGEKFKVGRDLARLGPQAFNYAAMNDIDPELARHVGLSLDDDGQQVGALQVMRDQGIRNADEADALVRQIRNAGFAMEKQPDLFEPSGFVWKANPLLALVARLETATRSQIVGARGRFGSAARNAEQLAQAGVGSVDRSKASALAKDAAAELEMLDQFVGKNTHTQEALKNAAAAVARGELTTADAIASVRAALRLDYQGQPVRSAAQSVNGPVEPLDVNAGTRPANADAEPGADVAAPGQSGPGLFDEPNAAVPPTAVDARKARKGGDESGQVSTQVATTVAGAGIGVLTGGAMPGTPEERRDRALLGGLVGGLAGTRVSRLAGKAPLPKGVPDLSKVPVTSEMRAATGGPAPRNTRVWRMTEWQPIAPNKPLPAHRIQSFNLSTFSPEIQHDVHNTIVKAMGMAEQRRSVMPIEAQVARAQRVAVNLSRVLKPGKTLNAEGLIAYGMAVENIGQRKATLARQIADQEAKGMVDGNLQKEWLETIADFDVVLRSWTGAGSEAGRALAAQKVAKRLMPAEVRVLMAAEKENPLSEQLRAAMLATNDPIEAVKLWQSQQQKGGMAKYILTNMLSGVQTQLRNTLGTAASTATKLVTKPLVTVPYDALRAALSGTPREVFAREAIEDFQGLAAGFQPAIRDAMHVLRYGFSAKHLQDALATGDTFKLPGREFAGAGKNPMNWVGRAMNASDRFFYTMNASAELHSRAYAMARKELAQTRLAPGSPQWNEALAKRATAIRMNPPADLTKAMDKAAREATFTGDPGVIGRLIGQMKHEYPALNFVIAFERTASNIMRTGYEYSPASLIVKGAKKATGKADAFGATGRESAEMVGKGAAGTLALLPLAYWASTGRLTGDGPRDPAKRAQLMESGWRPHSFLIGGKYVNYQFAQPLAFPAAVVANAFEAWADETDRQAVSTEPRSAARFATEAITRMGRSVLSQSFLTGLNDVLNAMDEGGTQGAKALENVLRTFVPLQGTLRNVQRAIDPVVRQPRSFGEQIKAGLPGLSTEVEPMLSRYGEPIVRSGGPIQRSIGVPEMEPQRRDWIDDELNRLNIQIGRPGTRVEIRNPITGELYRLSPEQTTAIRESRGKATRAELAILMGIPGYSDLPDELKRELIARARSQASRDVGDAAELSAISGDFGALEALLQPQRQIARESYRRE